MKTRAPVTWLLALVWLLLHALALTLSGRISLDRDATLPEWGRLATAPCRLWMQV